MLCLGPHSGQTRLPDCLASPPSQQAGSRAVTSALGTGQSWAESWLISAAPGLSHTPKISLVEEPRGPGAGGHQLLRSQRGGSSSMERGEGGTETGGLQAKAKTPLLQPLRHTPLSFKGRGPSTPQTTWGSSGGGSGLCTPCFSLNSLRDPQSQLPDPPWLSPGPSGVLTLQARDYPGSSGKPGGEGADPGEALRGGQRHRGGPSRQAGRPAGELGSRGTGAACRAAPTPPPSKLASTELGQRARGGRCALLPAPRTPARRGGRGLQSLGREAAPTCIAMPARGACPGCNPATASPGSCGPAW